MNLLPLLPPHGIAPPFIVLNISCYEAFQHFFHGFQKSVGRLRSKKSIGMTFLRTQEGLELQCRYYPSLPSERIYFGYRKSCDFCNVFSLVAFGLHLTGILTFVFFLLLSAKHKSPF